MEYGMPGRHSPFSPSLNTPHSVVFALPSSPSKVGEILTVHMLIILLVQFHTTWPLNRSLLSLCSLFSGLCLDVNDMEINFLVIKPELVCTPYVWQVDCINIRKHIVNLRARHVSYTETRHPCRCSNLGTAYLER